MEKFYRENSEDSDYIDRIPAHLALYINPDTLEMIFSCDWIDSDDDIHHMSEIFYQLKYGNLVDKILHNLYEQCVIDNRLNDFEKIKTIIESKVKKNKNNDQAVISPREIFKL